MAGNAAQVQLILNAVDNASKTIAGTNSVLGEMVVTSNRLALAQHEASLAAQALTLAEDKLASNKSPAAQQQLEGAVLKARVALDQADTSVQNYAQELTRMEAVTKKAGLSMKTMNDFTAGLGFNLQQFTNPAMLAGQAVRAFADEAQRAVDQYMDYAGKVRDFSVSLGISAEEASTLIQVADDLAIEAGSLKVAFRNMIDNGIQPSIASLKDAATKYQDLEDPVKQAAFAAELFGMRAGPELIKLLKETPAAIDAMAASAENAGLVMSEKALSDAEAYRKSLDELNDSWEGWKMKAVSEWIPTLLDVTTALNANSEAAANNEEQQGSLFDQLLRSIDAMDWALVVLHALQNAEAADVKETGALANKMGELGESTEEADFDVRLLKTGLDREAEAAYAAATAAERAQAATDALAQASSDTAAALGDVVAAQRGVAEAEQAWLEGTAQDVAGILENELGPGSERYAEGLEIIDDVMGTGLADQKEFEDAQSQIAQDFADGKINGEEFRTKLGELKESWMPLNEQIREANDLLWLTNLKYAALKDKEVHLTMYVEWINNGSPNPPGGGGGGGPTPDGGVNDETGETEGEGGWGDETGSGGQTFGKPGSGGSGGSGNIIVNVYPPAGASTTEIANQVIGILNQQVRAARTSGKAAQGI